MTTSIASKTDHADAAAILAAVLVDLTALRATVADLVTDNANRIANHNTLATKLNADAGVTDSDYAASTAAVSAAPSALTVAA